MRERERERERRMKCVLWRVRTFKVSSRPTSCFPSKVEQPSCHRSTTRDPKIGNCSVGGHKKYKLLFFSFLFFSFLFFFQRQKKKKKTKKSQKSYGGGEGREEGRESTLKPHRRRRRRRGWSWWERTRRMGAQKCEQPCAAGCGGEVEERRVAACEEGLLWEGGR